MKHRKLFTTIMLATTVFSLTGCGAKITQTNDELSAELGSELEVNISDFFTANKPEILSDFLVDTTAVKMNEVGTYNVTVAYENERYNISVNVQDTTAPIVTLKELGSLNEGDIVKVTDVVNVEELSEYVVAFKTDTVALDEITASEEDKEFSVLAKDIHGNTSEEIKVVFDVIPDEEDYNIFNHISENMTYDRKTKEYTITQELLVAIYDLVPQLSEYPKAYQDKILCSIASNKSIYDNAEEIQERIDSGLSEYWRYEDEYGPVGTQGGNTSTGNQQSSDGQQQGGNTSTGGQQSSGGQQGTTGGQQSGGYTESYTYITTTEDYKAADGSVYKNTGEVDPSYGSIFTDEYNHRYSFTTEGGMTMLPDSTDDFEFYDSEVNFTDHIRN